MSSPLTSYLLVGFVVLVLAAGQILFKTVGLRLTTFSVLWSDPSTFGIFCAALTLYGISTLAWIAALRTLPLSQAYIFTALGFVVIPLASHFLFGEPLTLRFALGTALIVGGILVAVT
jgi:multidrug transporter EmrE-like cation transporter